MNWLKYGAGALLLAIIISAAAYMWYTPSTRADPADEDDVIARVEDAENMLSHMEFTEVSMVGERILIQAEYTGDETTQPDEAAQWHQLAETTAQRFYQEVTRNRGVEVQIYQQNNLRAVAVAGL